MKRTIWVVIALLLLGLGVLFGPAYFAADGLRKAALAGDAAQMEQRVDFPMVRSELKAQMSAALLKKIHSDPSLAGNPFIGLAQMMVGTVVGKAVDIYVTPDGVAALASGTKPGNAASSEANEVAYRYEWLGINRFSVRPVRDNGAGSAPALVFERRGGVSWVLVKIDLPEDFLDSK